MLVNSSAKLFSELKKFLIHCTGSAYPQPRSICVEFIDCSDGISAHTCDKRIIFPRGAFDDSTYELFSATLMSLITTNTFNTV